MILILYIKCKLYANYIYYMEMHKLFNSCNVTIMLKLVKYIHIIIDKSKYNADYCTLYYRTMKEVERK